MITDCALDVMGYVRDRKNSKTYWRIGFRARVPSVSCLKLTCCRIPGSRYLARISCGRDCTVNKALTLVRNAPTVLSKALAVINKAPTTYPNTCEMPPLACHTLAQLHIFWATRTTATHLSLSLSISMCNVIAEDALPQSTASPTLLTFLTFEVELLGILLGWILLP